MLGGKGTECCEHGTVTGLGIVENHSNDFLGEGFVLEPDVGEPDFAECDWSDFNPEASEALPPNAPKPLGKGVPL